MLAGLIAGSVAAIVATLVSLPLRSPLDIAFNSLTVTLASLIVGVASGLWWAFLLNNPRRTQYYAGGLAAAFIVVAIASLVGGIWLERFASFTIPLAAIAFVISGIVTPLVGGNLTAARRGLLVVLVVASVGLGIALAGQGDTESGDLSLPQRAAAPSPTAPTPVPPEPTSSATTPTTAPAPTTTSASASPTTPAATAAPAAAQPDTPAAPTTPGETPSATPAPTSGATPVGTAEGAGTSYVVGQGSEITFTVGEVLSRFPTPIEAVMRTSQLSGQINLDGQASTVEVDLHSLTSDQEYRDRYVRQRMFPDHPAASFTVDAVTDLPDAFYRGEEFQRQVSGALTLNGASYPLTFDLDVRKDGESLNVLGRTAFTWQQLNIETPSARSVVSIEDEVRVQILLVAKPGG